MLLLLLLTFVKYSFQFNYHTEEEKSFLQNFRTIINNLEIIINLQEKVSDNFIKQHPDLFLFMDKLEKHIYPSISPYSLKSKNEFNDFSEYQKIISNQFKSISEKYKEKNKLWRFDENNKAESLVVITTSMSLWEKTILTILSIANNYDDFDLAVVDDKSKCLDIENKIKELSIKVIEWGKKNDTSKGVTHSWNVAWKYAVTNNYKYVFLINNDVLIPDNTIKSLVNSLKLNYASIVPMVNEKGSGNPFHRLNDHYKNTDIWTNNPLNYNIVQNIINKIVINKNESFIKEYHLINGYFMGFNIDLIRNTTYAEHNRTNFELFNPKFINIGNEDELYRRWKQKTNLKFGVDKTSFIFHYKGSTASKLYNNNGKLDRNLVDEKYFKGKNKCC